MAAMTDHEKANGIETGRAACAHLGWTDVSPRDLAMLLLCVVMSQKAELAEAFARIAKLEGKD